MIDDSASSELLPTTELRSTLKIHDVVGQTPLVMREWEERIYERIGRNEYISPIGDRYLRLGLRQRQVDWVTNMVSVLEFRFKTRALFSGAVTEPTNESLIDPSTEALLFLPEVKPKRELEELRQKYRELYGDEIDDLVLMYLSGENRHMDADDLVELAISPALEFMDKRIPPEEKPQLYKVTHNLYKLYSNGSTDDGYELNGKELELLGKLQSLTRKSEDGSEYFPASIASALQYVNKKAQLNFLTKAFGEEGTHDIAVKQPNELESRIQEAFKESDLFSSEENIVQIDLGTLSLGVRQVLIDIDQSRNNIMTFYGGENFSPHQLEALYQYPDKNKLLDFG